MCLCYLCFSSSRTVWSLLKFHPHELIIICVIDTRDLKIRLSTKVKVRIFEDSRKEATIGEYMSHALATSNYVHHYQVSQMNLSHS